MAPRRYYSPSYSMPILSSGPRVGLPSDYITGMAHRNNTKDTYNNNNNASFPVTPVEMSGIRAVGCSMHPAVSDSV